MSTETIDPELESELESEPAVAPPGARERWVRRVPLTLPRDDRTLHMPEESFYTMERDEREQRAQEIIDRLATANVGIRSWLVTVPILTHNVACGRVPDRVSGLFLTLVYALKIPSRRKRMPIHDIRATARLWVEQIADLLHASTREALDAADFRVDELLLPVLDAPIVQIREFAQVFREELVASPRIPWAVKSHYQRLLDQVILVAKDEDAIALQEELARRIAASVEAEIAPQLSETLLGALRWRPEELLQQITAALAAGKKPRLVGRQSCLFLQVGEGEDAPMVML